MSKIKELNETIEDLRNAAKLLSSAAQTLSGMISATPVEETHSLTDENTAVEKALSLEEVRAVLAEKSRAGYTAEVRVLLGKYGANKLSEVSQDKYGALLAEAEGLGNG